ncbi:hypothetical protein EV383_4390 [Pseudonocardia sediminis]|uniref:Uncharacterized protein n=1 Tax=Pseudonocardia sediminis TaxID=1397368 RepID=A0A4Q7UZN9_PSEST|nr:hypothetical protein [Pseudonocardia sediminis]RZT87466.1 hypothetical protein EV383_4390 [Pseudonocardia sediminis]
MAATAAETPGQQPTRRRRERKQTTLDHHIDRPSVVEPGDAPHDTTDPYERATSVEPDKAAAAAAGYQTVNAVIPLPQPEEPEHDKGPDRVEKYQVRGPDGKLVTVTHNLDTGETETD